MNLNPSHTAIPHDEGEAAQAASRSGGIYATWAPQYRTAGFWPVPVTPGSKACHMPNWQVPMADLDFNASLVKYPDHGIGVLLGSSFADGTTLAVLDVDEDEYSELAKAVLGDPSCIRRGARGIGIFVRLRGAIAYQAFKAKGLKKRHSELLTTKKLVVLPPSIHPDTGQPYRWLSPPLLDTNFRNLPLIEE